MGEDREQRAERLLGQLQQWSMEAMELSRPERPAFIRGIASQYHDDAIHNGLSSAQAEAWRDNITEWLQALIDAIENNGGAAGGHA